MTNVSKEGPTTKTKTALTAVEVLQAIPAHLDAHGWCQGVDHDGRGAACLRGAIDDLTSGVGPTRAEVHLRLHLTVGEPVVLFNDQTGRTVDEVKAACRDAATADLTAANLRGADLTSADLWGIDLSGVDLGGAVLSRSVLGDAVLRGTVLRRADLTRADLTGAERDCFTVWPVGHDPDSDGTVLVDDGGRPVGDRDAPR